MEMKEKKYKVKVICRNCHFGHAYRFIDDGVVISVKVGKSVDKEPCPKCGCKELIRTGRIEC